MGLEPREKSLESVPTTSKAPPAAPETHRTKRRVVLSDDEDSEPVVSRPPARKARPSFKTESTENSDAEREARALMDIDDGTTYPAGLPLLRTLLTIRLLSRPS